jgi:hypothetical protein
MKAQSKNLVRVGKAEQVGLPFKSSTYYKWAHLRKFPEIFVKIGGGLFIDLDAHNKLVEAGRLA